MVVQEKGARVLGDDTQLSRIVYPAEGGVRQGILVDTSDQADLSLTEQQMDALDTWNIAH